MDKRSSYTAASSLPAKVLRNKDVLDALPGIEPVHVQFIPTNRCNPRGVNESVCR